MVSKEAETVSDIEEILKENLEVAALLAESLSRIDDICELRIGTVAKIGQTILEAIDMQELIVAEYIQNQKTQGKKSRK